MDNIHKYFNNLLFSPGLGFSFILIPAVATIQVYFDKKRSLATGISFIGTGLGTLIMSQVVDTLLANFSWNETLLVLGLTTLTGLGMASVMRPLTHQNGERLSLTASPKYIPMEGSKSDATPWTLRENINSFVTNLRASSAEVFNFSILRQHGTCIMLLTGLLLQCGQIPPFVYLPSRALASGTSKTDSSFLVSLIGIGTIAGRLLLGWVADLQCVNSLHIYSVAILTCATCTLLSTLSEEYWWLCVYATCFGLLVGK